MAVLIDPPAWPAHGRLWSHLVSDTSLEELHDFAGGLGIPRRGFEGDHYDIPESLHPAALAAGARPVSARELLATLQRTGMRLRKRRGDRGIAKVTSLVFGDGTLADVELVGGRVEYPEHRVFAAMAFVADARGDLLAVYSVRREQWGSPGGWREPGESVRANATREIREETGLVVEHGQLGAVGYERFTVRHHGDLWRPGRDVLQAYRVELDEVRPPLASHFDDTSAREWVTPAQFEQRCRGLYWWPLAAHVLSGGAGSPHGAG